MDLFHRDPKKSLLKPRAPFPCKKKLSIPKSLCFVTGTGSNQPFFNMTIELLESIKGTQYKNVPIYILDCGLTLEDQQFLTKKFHVTIKDPGWDVDPDTIGHPSIFERPKKKEGWKAIISRPFIHEHFPGHDLYFWLDADTWIQDPCVIEIFTKEAQKTGIGCSIESVQNQKWKENHMFIKSLPQEYRDFLKGKTAVIANVYCIRKDVAKKYAQDAREILQKTSRYLWGFDLACLNFTIYKHVKNANILTQEHYNYNDHGWKGLPLVDDQGYLYSPSTQKALGFVNLTSFRKYLPYFLPMYKKGCVSPTKNKIFKLLLLPWELITQRFATNEPKATDWVCKLVTKITKTTLQTLHFRKLKNES